MEIPDAAAPSLHTIRVVADAAVNGLRCADDDATLDRQYTL